MDRASALGLYALVFRLAVIGAGTLFMTFGYRLFSIETARVSKASFEGNVLGSGFSLKNAAPGVFFALFGCIIVTVVVYRGVEFSFPDDHTSQTSAEASQLRYNNKAFNDYLKPEADKCVTAETIKLYRAPLKSLNQGEKPPSQ
jgi:hypothetical protein